MRPSIQLIDHSSDARANGKLRITGGIYERLHMLLRTPSDAHQIYHPRRHDAGHRYGQYRYPRDRSSTRPTPGIVYHVYENTTKILKERIDNAFIKSYSSSNFQVEGQGRVSSYTVHAWRAPSLLYIPVITFVAPVGCAMCNSCWIDVMEDM